MSTTGPPHDPESFAAHHARLRRRQTLRNVAIGAVALVVLWGAARVGEVDPAQFWAGFPRLGNYISDILPVIRLEHFGADVSEWMWGLDRWLALILDTLVIAVLGTALGGALALSGSFFAARNLAPYEWLGAIARRIHEIGRTVPEIVYALIFVYAFGIGPFAGVLAIILHTWGALGKLTAEANENIDMRPVEAAYACGCNWATSMRLAAFPQIAPNFLSYALFRLEINVRAASVLGIVGAGGIGQELYLAIRRFEYTDVSAILLLLIILVAIIDITSEHLRHMVIGRGAEVRA
ncbi:phosphonate ABC transporter, permease protein PhnE [Rhodobacteraceae bacterium WD3A24]|nr:phosphonate ABC transporter, permease protein PhnE [Rhodobacteraceae bacterium WD3A24]